MSVQTSVTQNFAVAIEGGVQVCVRERTRQADTAMQNGRFVCQGVADGTCKLPASAADVGKPIGITPYKATAPVGFPSSNTQEYAAGDIVGAVSEGEVWVVVEEAVNAQDPVYVRFAVDSGNSLLNLGAFRKSADPVSASPTAALAPNLVYLTSAAASGLARVGIALP